MSYVIKSEEELKDPFLCYCLLHRFNEELDEDYLEYNKEIINSVPFMFWLKGRGDITNEQLEAFIAIDPKANMQDILESDILYPNTYGSLALAKIKTYTLLAEYMSQLKEFRKRLWESVLKEVPKSDDKTLQELYPHKSLACIIDEDDMKSEEYTYDVLIHMSLMDFLCVTYKNQFNIGIQMSLKDADVETDMEKGM